MTLNVFLSHLKYILQLSLVKFSVSLTFFQGRTGQDGHTTHRGTWTDRLFLENIILDINIEITSGKLPKVKPENILILTYHFF